MKGRVDEITSHQQARRTVADPYALAERPPGADGEEEADRRGIAHDEALDQWVGPFVMATYNTRIVRRSNAMQDFAYGTNFR